MEIQSYIFDLNKEMSIYQKMNQKSLTIKNILLMTK